MLLDKPISEWPRCDALLVWESQGFPLKKAQEYVRLTKPFLINDVFKQDLLLDRRRVYQTLKAHRIPMPPHVIVSRTEAQIAAAEDPEGFEESEDYISMACCPLLVCQNRRSMWQVRNCNMAEEYVVRVGPVEAEDYTSTERSRLIACQSLGQRSTCEC